MSSEKTLLDHFNTLEFNSNQRSNLANRQSNCEELLPIGGVDGDFAAEGIKAVGVGGAKRPKTAGDVKRAVGAHALVKNLGGKIR